MLPFAVGARRRNVILDVGQEQGQRGEQQRRRFPGDTGDSQQDPGHNP